MLNTVSMGNRLGLKAKPGIAVVALNYLAKMVAMV